MWAAAPYNNFFLNNSYISDTYLPVSGVIFVLLLVLGLNPLLRLMGPKWVLNFRQLALVFAMLLTAAILPSQGLLRMLPWSLARSNHQLNHQSVSLADAFEKSGVPHALFPDEIGYNVETPASDQFLDELAPGESIPWDAWLPLVPVWGCFLLACWLMMIGTGMVLYPHWRDTERLPFPLLDVYRSLLPQPGSDQVLPALFKERLFWTGAGIVMFLYALSGLDHHTHGMVPSVPLGWQLSSYFQENPWRYLHSSIKNVRHIYFVLVGMAFFMPNRVGFSIWFFTIAYGVFEMVHRAYFPPHYGGMVADHRNGAMIAIAFMVLFLSWKHWRHVGRLLFNRATTDADRLLQVSGWMIVTGALGMFIWLQWANVPLLWAAAFVFIGFMVSVLIARIVAETGLPFVRITGLNPTYLMAMLPAGWLSGAAIYMAGFITLIFQLGSRVNAAVMAFHAAAVDDQASAKHQLRIGYMMIVILAVGFVVAGAIHLHMGYTQPYTMDGSYAPLNAWGGNQLRGVQNDLLRWSGGSWNRPSDRLPHLAFGVAFAGALQAACMVIPRWPLHPIGLLIVGHYYGQMAWASVLIGWSIKVTAIHFGGATAFRFLRPLFLGLIMGEIFSAVIWTLVPIVLLLMGYDPADIGHIHLLPT